jgi:hypothetical protein
MRLFKWNNSALLLATIILICNIFHSIAEEGNVVVQTTNIDNSESVEADSRPNVDDVSPVSPPPVVEDENSKIAKDLFRAAAVMLNSSSPDRHSAWDMMEKSADLGNVDAKVRIAFAKLAGVFFEQV